MASRTKNEADTRLFVDMVARHQGWRSIPDGSFKNDLVAGLTVNYNRYGYFLCPCRDSRGDHGGDRDVICPCRYARADIEEFGHCYCGLYLSPAFATSGREPGSIPERRPE